MPEFPMTAQRRVIRHALRAGCAATALALGWGPALAQTASQITPPTFAPPPARTPAPIVISDSAGAVAPAGSDTLDITLAGVSLDGPADPVALQDLRTALVGHTIKVSDIFAAARTLEARYANAGHVLVRVVVPAQSLTDGATLHLVLVDGFIERIDVAHVPTRVRAQVAATLRPLVDLTSVTLSAIERRLLLAADMPGIALRSTLVAGSKPGATILVIEATQQPVTGFATLDNTLPSSLGRLTFGVGLNFNSLLGAGETIYLRASGLPDISTGAGVFDPTPRDRALAGGVILPLGHNGLAVNIEGTDARTTPRHDSTLPGFGSVFRRLSGRLSYPLVRSRALTISAQAVFDAQDEKVAIVTPAVLPLSLDRLRIARLGGGIRLALPGNGVATMHGQASVGLDALGARNGHDATALLPLSRLGEKTGFHKLDIEATLDQPLASHLVANLKARGQTSFGEVMANSEQIGIATLDGISPFASGAIEGDAGYVVRGELRAPFALQLGTGFGQLAPYGFAAYGQVRFYQPTIVERGTTDVSAYGAGVRLSAGTRSGIPGVSASVEYGHAHAQGPLGSAHRVSFTIITQF